MTAERRCPARIADDRRVSRRLWWVENVVLLVVAIALASLLA